MASPAASPAPDAATMLRLTKGLEHMRDSLVELSLILRDIQFESDIHHRAETSRSATQMLQKIGGSPGSLPP